MKKSQKNETVEEKRERLSNSLKELAPKWPYRAKMQWSLSNGYHHASVERYLKGKVTSIVVAERIEAEILEYTKQNAA